MTDMTAFERRVADGMLHRAGPVRPVDDLAIYESVIAANRQKGWGFTMFSALKFVAAAVIVALFGGFLLAGILTTPQGEDMAPAAVTASPSPMTTDELLAGMVTEEVEPGVYRVVNDGVRDLTNLTPRIPASSPIVAGQDGSIWLARGGDLVRLGHPQTPAPWDDEFDDLVTFSVAPDGTVWAVVQRGGLEWRLRSLDGDTWTTHPVAPSWTYFPQGFIEVTPHGRVWAASADGPLGYLEADGSMWQIVQPPRSADAPEADSADTPEPGWDGFIATDSDLWAPSQDGVWHYADGTWEYIPYGGPDSGAMPDDAFWGLGMGSMDSYVGTASDMVLHRHDGRGWQRWPLEEQGMLPVWGANPNEYAVAPDGSFWSGWMVYDTGSDTVRYPGISRFDGQTWTRYLPGMFAFAMDIAPDGSVWVVAMDWYDHESAQGPEPKPNVYVITPEAVE